MLHPAVRLGLAPNCGVGLFAMRPIAPGTVVWHPSLASLQVSPEEAPALPPFTFQWLDELGYRLSNGNMIFPSGGACFFNHSCSPNIVDYGIDFGFATKEIEAGEQLLIDYSSFVHDPFFTFAAIAGRLAVVESLRTPKMLGERDRP